MIGRHLIQTEVYGSDIKMSSRCYIKQNGILNPFIFSSSDTLLSCTVYKATGQITQNVMVLSVGYKDVYVSPC